MKDHSRTAHEPPSDDTPDDELASLVSDAIDGVLTAESLARLEVRLKADAAARAYYLDAVWLNSCLVESFSALTLTSLLDVLDNDAATRHKPGQMCGLLERLGTQRGPRASSARRGAALVMAGMAAAVGLAVVISSMRHAPRAVMPAELTPAGLATLSKTRFLRPADSSAPLAVGQTLGPGTLEILGGALELTYRNGVVLVLEGPGEIELLSEMRAFLHSGSVVVRMPEGMSGFHLETPTTDVVDLGTEFAVKAADGFVTDVQVFDGAVVASDKSKSAAAAFPKRLEAGEAVRFSPNVAGESEAIPFAAERFVRALPPDAGIARPDTHVRKGHAGKAARERLFGRPRHHSIVVSRALEPMTIDGRLDEWAAVDGFTASLTGDASDTEWVDGRMMYDDSSLYIAARVGDPAPLRSTIDPMMDPAEGWRGGAVQVRLSTDRSDGWPVNANSPLYYAMRRMEPTAAERQAADNPKLAHLTMWYHAASKTPCLTIAYGMHVLTLVVNPSGYQGTFTREADGKGYVLEYAIPWRLLNCEQDPPRAGDTLAAAWQVLWSDGGGRLWRDQVIEIRNPREPRETGLWERAATWGRADYR